MNATEIANTTYEDCQEKIERTVGQFAAKYRAALRSIGWYDLEELTSRGNLHFSVLLHRWTNGQKTERSFLTEVGYWVWFCLLDEMRMEIDLRKRQHLTDQLDAHPARTSLPMDFLENLGADAQLCAALVLHQCRGEEQATMATEVEEKAQARGGTPRNYRSALRDVLRAAGWKMDRISRAFDALYYGEAV